MSCRVKVEPMPVNPAGDRVRIQTELFKEKWNSKYPLVAKSWTANWQRINPMFALPKEIRRAVYTTNVIESLNYSLRKITKTRAAFPSEEAAVKLLYLGLQNCVRQFDLGSVALLGHPINWR